MRKCLQQRSLGKLWTTWQQNGNTERVIQLWLYSKLFSSDKFEEAFSVECKGGNRKVLSAQTKSKKRRISEGSLALASWLEQTTPGHHYFSPSLASQANSTFPFMAVDIYVKPMTV